MRKKGYADSEIIISRMHGCRLIVKNGKVLKKQTEDKDKTIKCMKIRVRWMRKTLHNYVVSGR